MDKEFMKNYLLLLIKFLLNAFIFNYSRLKKTILYYHIAEIFVKN